MRAKSSIISVIAKRNVGTLGITQTTSPAAADCSGEGDKKMQRRTWLEGIIEQSITAADEKLMEWSRDRQAWYTAIPSPSIEDEKHHEPKPYLSGVRIES